MTLVHLFLALLVVAVWGFNFVVIKLGLAEASPLFLVTARFILTSFPAVFLIKRPQAPFKMVVLYGLIMFALQFSLVFFAIHLGVTAGLASILLQVQAFFAILLAALVFKEKISLWQVIGAGISFLGIGAIAVNMDSNCTLAGFSLMIAAAFFWAMGSVLAKAMGKVHMISLIAWASIVAWPPLLVATLFVDGIDSTIATCTNLSWLSIGSIAYTTYLSTFFGFGIWNWLIQRYPLSTVGPFTLLVPVFGMLSSCIILEELLPPWKVYAILLVIGGISINLVGSYLTVQIKSLRN